MYCSTVEKTLAVEYKGNATLNFIWMALMKIFGLNNADKKIAYERVCPDLKLNIATKTNTKNYLTKKWELTVRNNLTKIKDVCKKVSVHYSSIYFLICKVYKELNTWCKEFYHNIVERFFDINSLNIDNRKKTFIQSSLSLPNSIKLV